MDKLKYLKYSILALAFLYGMGAKAECKGSQNMPSEQVHVAFEVSSSQISASERTRLREWVDMVNSKYAIQNWTTIVGSAAESEPTAKALAMRRAVIVAREALEDGLVNAPLQVKAQVYPVAKSGKTSSDSREVTVEISPGCPSNCCDGH
ncbi:OmpA family protein [Paraburkholderia sacchari]|uniref:OmpA family protein n=1 Tax=Paraburkholderia sacchari TaxID=159450 RepID=A0A8T6ZGL4_9BURK|nr:OmpA family protein [Paraburkholderia sacchari]NLP63364.1 OmpA family protein [Paraburkholderia sacchari]